MAKWIFFLVEETCIVDHCGRRATRKLREHIL
jgi:hypothetical protein